MLAWLLTWLFTPQGWKAKLVRGVIVALILASIFYSRYLEHMEAVR